MIFEALVKKKTQILLTSEFVNEKNESERDFIRPITPCTKVLFCGGMIVAAMFLFCKRLFLPVFIVTHSVGVGFSLTLFLSTFAVCSSFRREKTAFVLIFLFLELFLEFFSSEKSFDDEKDENLLLKKELTYSWGENTWHFQAAPPVRD